MSDESIVERLAEKWKKERVLGMRRHDRLARWWLNAIADELKCEADTRGPGQFGGHYRTTADWLRIQASTGEGV